MDRASGDPTPKNLPAFGIGNRRLICMLHHMPSKQDLLDLQFIAARHKLIELAAFLDRLDRHPGPDDHRLTAMRLALPILLNQTAGRAQAILKIFSDQSVDPIERAPMQGATGAPVPSTAPAAIAPESP